MHVAFDFTHDDMTEVSMASYAASATYRNQRWRNAVVSAGSGAVIVVLLGLRTLPFSVWMGLSLLAAGVAGMTEWALQPGRLRAALGRHVRELLPGPGPFSCLVALEPEGLFTTQNGTTVLHPWEQVTAVRNDAAWGVEVHGRTGILVLVRDRAFATPEERQEFADRAEALRQGGARQSWGPGEAGR